MEKRRWNKEEKLAILKVVWPPIIQTILQTVIEYNQRRHSSLNDERPYDIYQKGLAGISNQMQN
jgi:regulator of sigma D